jgi:pimeloyl-ACP methyl ester carboxylesterase
MPYAESSAGKLFYTVSRGIPGDPTLLLVHGAGGSRLHWPAELRRLSNATVYTLDLPGHGRSEGSGYDHIDRYAEAVISLMDYVGIEKCVTVGHSMGGAIAQMMALAHADRVAGLVLVATGARLRVSPAVLEGIRSDFEATAALITLAAWSTEASPRLTALGQKTLLRTGADVLLADFGACDRFDVMECLGQIHVPTLVVVGSADQLTPLKYAHFLAENIPDVQLRTIENAGHMVMLERPEMVELAIQQFIEGMIAQTYHRNSGGQSRATECQRSGSIPC